MRFLDRFQTRKVIQVKTCSFPDLPVLEVDIQTLQKLARVIYETPNDFFVIHGETVYRSIKEPMDPSPLIIECENIAFNPDHTSVIVDCNLAWLTLFAVRSQSPILADPNSFYLISPNGIFRAKREKVT